MPDLKLPKLRDRTPIKLTINVLPDIHAKLEDYARLYAETYGSTAPIVDLIPAMLDAFLESDRTFLKARAGAK